MHRYVRIVWVAAAGAIAVAGFIVGRTSVPIGQPSNSVGELASKLTRIEASLDKVNSEVMGLGGRVERLQQLAMTSESGSEPDQQLPSQQDKQPPALASTAKEEQQYSQTNEVAQMAAEKILQTAMSRGRWTDADREQMREHFQSLDSESKFNLMRQLAMAVNEGRVSINDLRGPPLY